MAHFTLSRARTAALLLASSTILGAKSVQVTYERDLERNHVEQRALVLVRTL